MNAFRVGDIVSRSGSDRQRVVAVLDEIIEVECVVEPDGDPPWVRLGQREANFAGRYRLVLPVGVLLSRLPTPEEADAFISFHQTEESAMKISVVDNFRDPEETAIPVEASDKRQQPKPTRPALGDLFLVPDYDHDVAFGPFKTEDEAIAAAKEEFIDNGDPEDDARYFLCRIAKKLRLFRPVQMDEEESEDR